MAKINYIVSGVNRLIGAGESFPYYYEHFALYCDTTIDLINETLNTEFKTIQEAYEDSTETPEDEIPETFNYKEIPEKYIRSILIYHTAALFLEEEDEFEDQYKVYRDRALSSLAEWRKLEYSDFDITDSTYPYEALKPYQDHLYNVDKFYNHTDQLEKDYEDLIERDKAREDE